MELLFSNIPPMRTDKRSMNECFEDLFHEADTLRIASGYISADSLAELKRIIEVNNKAFLELIIGMHGYEGFTRSQYEAAVYLNDYLHSHQAGSVKISTAFKYHGKIYCFTKNNVTFAGVIGSSNISSVLDNSNVYETDILLNEQGEIREIEQFIKNLSEKACIPLNNWDKKIIIADTNKLLEGHDDVEKAGHDELVEVMSKKSATVFRIPIKSDEAPHSNLNAFFGRGRENKRGLVKPRHWYEVELIVPKSITDDPAYPKAGYPDRESTIIVYTDDGWKFQCKISGQNSKNLRSAGDLKILGKWIKGRLENSGALKVGEPVTDEVLKKYGRDNFELISTSDPTVWLLNFGV